MPEIVRGVLVGKTVGWAADHTTAVCISITAVLYVAACGILSRLHINSLQQCLGSQAVCCGPGSLDDYVLHDLPDRHTASHFSCSESTRFLFTLFTNTAKLVVNTAPVVNPLDLDYM